MTSSTTAPITADTLLAAECEKPVTNEQGMPGAPVRLCGGAEEFLSQIIQYTTYFAIAAAFASGALVISMIVLDKNRGEAGLASSDHSRLFKWAIGCFIIASAFTLARAGFALWAN